MSMKACHTNRTVTSSGDVVLRNMKTVSSKERVDPRVIELRAILLPEEISVERAVKVSVLS